MLRPVLEIGQPINNDPQSPGSYRFDLDFDTLSTQIDIILNDEELNKAHQPDYQQFDADIQAIMRLLKEIQHFMTQPKPLDYVQETLKKLRRVQGLTRKMLRTTLSVAEDNSQMHFIAQKILKASTALQQQLTNALLNKKTENEPRVLESYALFCEQWQMTQQDEAFNEILEETLKKVGALVENTHGWRPSVFMSYAWPSIQNKQTEFWLQSFLARLRHHLYLAGCDVQLDIIDCQTGQNIYQFMEAAQTDEKIILVCTSTLKDKHRYGMSAVATELNHIRNKRRLDEGLEEENILPISLAGIFGENFPVEFEKYTNIAEWRGRAYLNNVKKLICAILSANHSQVRAIDDLWQPLTNSQYNEPMSKAVAQQTMQDAYDDVQQFQAEIAVQYSHLARELSIDSALPQPINNQPSELTELATQLRTNPVVFITDPGSDDLGMLGLGLSSTGGFQNILGIVGATGNVSLHNVKRNILGMLSLTQRNDVKVFEGRNQKLTPDYAIADGSAIFSKKGVSFSGTVTLPDIEIDDMQRFQPLQELIDTIKASQQKVTLISTAGLTDVCLILDGLETQVKNKIAGITIMGGAFSEQEGNAPLSVPKEQRVSEFNFCWDPDATQKVVQTCASHDIPIILAATDITHHYGVYGKQQTQQLRTLTHNPTAKFLADLFDDVPEFYEHDRYKGQEQNFPIHDLFAIMCLLDPDNFTCERIHLECTGGTSDTPGRSTKTVSNTGCVLNLTTVIDEQRFYRCYLEGIRAFKLDTIDSPSNPNTLSRSGSPIHSRKSTDSAQGSSHLYKGNTDSKKNGM